MNISEILYLFCFLFLYLFQEQKGDVTAGNVEI